MSVALPAALWLLALASALYAAEKLVHFLVQIGHAFALSAGLVGLLVAAGADAPEVTSALAALSQGASDIGLGVVVGSNIYNLAGLLGLTAFLASGFPTGAYRLTVDGITNVVLTLLLIGMLFWPHLRVLFAVSLLVGLLCYVLVLTLGNDRMLHFSHRAGTSQFEFKEPAPKETAQHSPRVASILAFLSVGVIVLGSDLLVHESIDLGPKLHLPSVVISTFLLPIATSLPNTWAAISLARRGMASAAVSATFNSNSINIVLGAGLPSVFLAINGMRPAHTFELGWLIGMTLVAIVLLATRRTLSRLEGGVLIGLYLAFAAIRLAL